MTIFRLNYLEKNCPKNNHLYKINDACSKRMTKKKKKTRHKMPVFL
jgi:hypothetical protein